MLLLWQVHHIMVIDCFLHSCFLKLYFYSVDVGMHPCEACAVSPDQLITAACSFRLHMDSTHDSPGL